jgi:hypothetical protein
VDLYDRIFFKPLPLTDVRPSIDPYTPENVWQGASADEATALRFEDIDLRYSIANIHRSRSKVRKVGLRP